MPRVARGKQQLLWQQADPASLTRLGHVGYQAEGVQVCTCPLTARPAGERQTPRGTAARASLRDLAT